MVFVQYKRNNMKLSDLLNLNEAKYDIGMARKGNGITVYNKAEEENGDYKNVAHIDNRGKVKYYDKKLPSNIKKEIERKAAEMMEMATENGMKLTDLIKESNVQMGKVYSNPYAKSFVKEEEEERPEPQEMTEDQRAAFLEAVKGYKTYGESVYRKEGLAKVYESIRGMVEMANKVTLAETGDWFDGVTVSRHMKRMNESFKVFEKTLREVSTLQQRLESSYDEIGEVLGKYYEINELEEGNEFGAARAKAIAAGDSEFEVDGKKYKVTNVDDEDRANAKKFANESKSMKLTSMLNEGFGIGDLPSSKLPKMKMSLAELMNERDDAGTHLDKLADLVGNANSLMSVGKELKRAKYKYNFSTGMMPMYTIDVDGHRFAILNKKYVDKGDREVGDIAIGLLENLTTEGKDDFNASYSGVNINLKKGYKRYNEDELMKLYSALGKAINRMKGIKSVEVVFEGVVNESKYTVINPSNGNPMGYGTKAQAVAMAKKKGGSKKGFYVVPQKNALKARRAMEKHQFKMTSKLKNILDDLYYESTIEQIVGEGASTEEKRIVMMAVRKIAKYRNVSIDVAAGDVMRAAKELERDIEKGKVKSEDVDEYAQFGRSFGKKRKKKSK